MQEVAADCAWLVLSPALRGRLHALDSADEVAQLGGFAMRFTVGQSLCCRVVQVFICSALLVYHRSIFFSHQSKEFATLESDPTKYRMHHICLFPRKIVKRVPLAIPAC